MIGGKLEDALNKQINAELYSSYLYLSMAAYFESINMKGMAGWMYAQSHEETAHGKKFFGHINERGGRVILDGIDTPKKEWGSPLEVFKDAYAHEQKVTKMIYDLVDLAASEKDHAASAMLQWFVTEQVEEEDNASTVVDILEKIQDSPNGLFMLDHQLGARGKG